MHCSLNARRTDLEKAELRERSWRQAGRIAVSKSKGHEKQVKEAQKEKPENVGLRFQPDGGRAPMGIETLQCAERLNDRNRLLQGMPVHLHPARAPLEHIRH